MSHLVRPDAPTARPDVPRSPVPGNRDGDRSAVRSRNAAEARRRSARRPMVDPTTCERDYTPSELEFMNAMQAYKQSSGRMFPTWSEVLEVLRELGYRKNSQ